MDLSIIIVNYNVKEFLQNLLHSIFKAGTNLNYEIIVVDNASDDGSAEIIREKFPAVKLIVNKVNLGFGKANNLAMKIAAGKYLLLLNPDTIVREDTFEKMISFFEKHKEAGLAGCKILNPDGTLQLACRRSFPGPWTSFTKVTGLSNLFPKNKLFARYNLTYLNENETYEVDAISGSFMMMTKEVYDKVGGFDEQFFMYGEDLDLCYRIQKAGYKVYYVPETQIIHYKGESTKRSSYDEVKFFYSAMHLFVKKHLSSSFIVELILRSAIVVRGAFAFLARKKLIIISMTIDFIIFNLCLYAAEKVYMNLSGWKGFPDSAVIIVYTVPAVIQMFIATIVGAYRQDKISVLKIQLSVLFSLPVLTSLTFFFKEFAYSRAVVLISYLFLMVFLSFWRAVAKVVFKVGLSFDSAGQKRTLVVGLNETALMIGHKLQYKRTDLRNIVGLIGFSNKEVGMKINSFEVVGTDQNIQKIIKEFNVNEIIFSSSEISYNKMMEIVSRCQNENVEFKIVGSNLEFIVGKTAVTLLDDMPLIELHYNISDSKMKFIKTLFDICLSFPALFLIYPFIYFNHKLSGRKSDFSDFILNVPKVLTGKYSFVGPKSRKADNLYFGKPGLTGYWYIEYGNQEEIEKLDFYYAKNQNIWLDLEILGKSLNKMWSKNS